MGFFSWNTSDTLEPIWNVHSEGYRANPRSVYLYGPHGQVIEEPAYDGYGRFGDHDAFVLLARWNVPELVARKNEEETRDIGVSLECGLRVYHDPETDTYHSMNDSSAAIFSHLHPDRTVERHHFHYETPIEGYGMTANELVAKGRWKEVSVADELAYPLKFSYRPDAAYQSLMPATPSRTQGIIEMDKDERERHEEAVKRLAQSPEARPEDEAPDHIVTSWVGMNVNVGMSQQAFEQMRPEEREEWVANRVTLGQCTTTRGRHGHDDGYRAGHTDMVKALGFDQGAVVADSLMGRAIANKYTEVTGEGPRAREGKLDGTMMVAAIAYLEGKSVDTVAQDVERRMRVMQAAEATRGHGSPAIPPRPATQRER